MFDFQERSRKRTLNHGLPFQTGLRDRFSTSNLRLFMRYRRLVILFALVVALPVSAQPFTAITIDPTPTPTANIMWVDIDTDGDQDLILTTIFFADTTQLKNRVYLNEDGTLTRVTDTPFTNKLLQTNSATAADYDNDGDDDLYLGNSNFLADIDFVTGSTLWKNDGGNLTVVEDSILGVLNDLGGTGVTWGDYDNDGDLDLYVSVHTVFGRDPDDDAGNDHLYDNNGDGTFTRNTTALPVTLGANTSAQPVWMDYDGDGDLDLSITNAFFQEVAGLPSFFFTNQLIETGTATFVQDTESAYAKAELNPPTMRWIDYDNDDDLDLYFIQAAPGTATPGQSLGASNSLWRNDGGTFTEVTEGPHVNDLGLSLAQVWADYDNDGDLDLLVTNGTSRVSTGGAAFYSNDGPPHYTFTRESVGSLTASGITTNGAAAADYDNDGDLDLYVSLLSRTGTMVSDRLYRNETSGNQWVRFRLEGARTDDPASTGSNRSAIGAVVRIRATIDGQVVRQRRNISANDGYADRSDIAAHFGLGDATVLEQVEVTWPSGRVQTFENLDVNVEYRLLEGSNPSATSYEEVERVLQPRLEVYPNPAHEAVQFAYEMDSPGSVRLMVYDMLGREVAAADETFVPAGAHVLRINGRELSSGVYVARLEVDHKSAYTTSFAVLP